MSHRRKSSNPLCKQRRLGLVVDRVLAAKNKHENNKPKDDDGENDSHASADVNNRNHGNEIQTTSLGSDRSTPDAQEQGSKGSEFQNSDKPNLEIPADLLTDFEALKSATHLDTAALMRKLIHDYSRATKPVPKCNVAGISADGVQDIKKLTDYYNDVNDNTENESMDAPLDLSILKPSSVISQSPECLQPTVQFVPYISGIPGFLPSPVSDATESKANVRKGSTLFPTNIESPKTPKMALPGMYLYSIGGQTFPLAFSPPALKFPSLVPNSSDVVDASQMFPANYMPDESPVSSTADQKIVQNIKKMEALSRKQTVSSLLAERRATVNGSSSVSMGGERQEFEAYSMDHKSSDLTEENQKKCSTDGSVCNGNEKMPQLTTQTSVVNSVNHPITAMSDFIPEMGQIISKDQSERLKNLDKLPVLNPNILRPLPHISPTGHFTPLPIDSKEADMNLNPKIFQENKISDKEKLTNIQTVKNTRLEKSRSTKKNSGRMKLLAENMSTKGVYTSVLKLPWSKRTRTAKTENGRKVSKQLVDQDQHSEAINKCESSAELTQTTSATVTTSQPMVLVPLDSANVVPASAEGVVFVPNSALSQIPNMNSEEPKPDLSGETSASTQPMMLVYPNSTFSSANKPARKRGRPPKAPVLAQMLSEANKMAMQGNVVPGFLPALQQTAAIVLNVNNMVNTGSMANVSVVGSGTSENAVSSSLVSMPMPSNSMDFQCSPQSAGPSCSQDVKLKQEFVAHSNMHEIAPNCNSNISSPVWNNSNNYNNNVPKTPNTQEFVQIQPRRSSAGADQGLPSTSSSGALYQEMILSSKSLVNVQPRRRQTTTELIQSKAGYQDFICTSFRLGSLNGKSKKSKKNLGMTAGRRRGRPPKKEASLSEDQETIPARSVNDAHKFQQFFQQPQPSLHSGITSDSQEVTSPIHEFGNDLNESMLPSSGLEQDSKLFDGMTDGNYDNPIVATQIEKSNHEMQLAQEEWQHRFVYASDEEMTNDNSDRLVIENSDPEEEGNDTSHGMFQKLFHCKLCNEIIPVNMKNEHWAKHAHSKTKCQVCGEVFLKEKKQGRQEDVCDKCEKAQKEGQIHCEMDNTQTRIVCDFCSDNVADIKELKAHVRQVHPKSYHIFKAKLMGLREKHSKEIMAIKKQKATASIKSHELKVYECPIEDCSKKLYSKFGIKHHLRKRHESDIGASIKMEMARNSDVIEIDDDEDDKKSAKHYNIKGYQCSWPGCVDEFSTERSLKVHLLVHKDEKPFTCDMCDYRCHQPSTLQWHVKKNHIQVRERDVHLGDDVLQEMDIQ